MPDIIASSGYGFNTRKPFVNLQMPDGSISAQLLPDEARRLADSLYQSAEAAEQDAFLVEWVEETIGKGDLKIGAVMLAEYRKWREEHAA